MGKCVCIGEILADFIAKRDDTAPKSAGLFECKAGGAPANTAACISRLGGHSLMASQVGEDFLGVFLLKELAESGVDTTFIATTNEARTGHSLVFLDEEGNREFVFYRDNCADLLLNGDQLSKLRFDRRDILHFCSIDLVPSPMKDTHMKLIQRARNAEAVISFDPNVRQQLWPDSDLCRETIREFIPLADIIKISEDELEFITGKTDIRKAYPDLFTGHVKIIVFTKGKNGSEIHTRSKVYHQPAFPVKPVDTTGCGDAFIGAFLYEIMRLNLGIENLETAEYGKILIFASAVGAIVSKSQGAIDSLPDMKMVREFLENAK